MLLSNKQNTFNIVLDRRRKSWPQELKEPGTVCFPMDRQDPRRDSEQWFMDRWNRQVGKWKRWTQAKGMSVEFEYWGGHELLTRLSLEEQRGRFFFWFHRELFSYRWFQERLDEAIVDAGPRYTPELNIERSTPCLFALYSLMTLFGKLLQPKGDIRFCKRLGTTRSTQPFQMPWLLCAFPYGTRFVIRLYLKTLMSFYFHAQRCPASSLLLAPLLAMCKVKVSFRYNHTDRPAAFLMKKGFLRLCQGGV